MHSIRQLHQGDCLEVLKRLPDGFSRLAYIDPPFGTGRVQKRDRIRVQSTEGEGDRKGFGGKSYEVEHLYSGSFEDDFEDFEGFLMPRIEESLRCLTPDGSILIHLDPRNVHYIKVAMDKLLGRNHFMNEIIWAFDYGARSRSRWPAKHNNILWYVKDPKNYVFEYDAVDRIPYMAPDLVTPEKAALGKKLTDTWFLTIVPTNGAEKTGYPTQKPMKLMDRLIRVHSRPEDVVLDFFAGSSSTAQAAADNGRGFVMVDSNPEAIQISAQRLISHQPHCFGP